MEAATEWEPLRGQLLEGLRRALLFPAEGRVDPPIEFPPMAGYMASDAMTRLASA